MNPLWHPLGALLLDEPRAFATPAILKFLLAARGRASLIYAGDAMWPAVAHGEPFEIVPLADPAAVRAGDAVVASTESILDLFRVASLSPAGARLVADSDPGGGRTVPSVSILARAALPRKRSSRLARTARRILLEAREAASETPRGGDPASTVRDKYDHQAVFYARGASGSIAPTLRERLLLVVPRGARMLVAGSGAGKESFALAQDGWRVKGIDFAASMVAASRDEARRLGADVDFEEADLRAYEEPEGSLGAIVFTYDVYSFLPGRAARIDVLRRMRRWLASDAALFLSARRATSWYQRSILTLQHAVQDTAGEWGDSHTRWIATNGEMRRSFLRVFTDRDLASEARAAGFEIGTWEGGHAMLRPRSPSC